MAIQNPSNLYTGGAVVFNTQPSTNYALQLMAQRKAKDEALDEYYRKLPQTINEAGMRDQDRPGFMQRVGALQQYYLQHRDAIKDPRRDGGAAQYNFEKLFRETRGYTDQSKGLAKSALEVGKRYYDPNSQYLFRNGKFMDAIHRNDLAIDDPQHQPIDYTRLPLPPKPRTVEDWQRLDNTLAQDLTPGQTPTGKVETLPNFQKRTHFIKQFDPKTLETIGNRAIGMYGTDYDWQGAADERYEQALKNPKELELLNKVFEPVMKRPIKDAADLFAAERIVAHSQATPGYKDEDDKKAYADYRFSQQVALKRIPQATSGGGSGSGANAEFNDAFSVVERKVNTDKANGYTYTRFNALPAMTQNVLLKYARQNTGGDAIDYNQATMYIKPNAAGSMQLKQMVGKQPNFDKDPVVMDIGYLDVNFTQQADVKGKRAAVNKNNQQQTTPQFKGLTPGKKF